jgi:prolyl 4-hydroxylase
MQVYQSKSSEVQLFLIDDFLSSEECSSLIEIGHASLRPSTVTNPDAGADFRTSETCDIGIIKNPLVQAVSERISSATGISQEYSEVMQMQKYSVGHEFKSHTDYFEPNTPEYIEHASVRGNRTWTCMIYLNPVEQGGETLFSSINELITPKMGRAVIWNNLTLDGNVNPKTIHAGLPILQGEKYILTTWFRQFV